MAVFFVIVVQVIIPVFILIAAGAYIHRIFQVDLNTLSKLNLYLLLPCVTFTNIYESSMNGGTIIQILAFLLVQNMLLMAVSWGIAKAGKYDQSMTATFKNSVVLNNSGNFGLPVSQLVFQSNPLGASIQVIVSIFQYLLTNTYGLLNVISAKSTGTKVLLEFLKLPTLYALVLGLLLNITSVPIPVFLWNTIENMSNAFLAVALLTLGAQSAYIQIKRVSLPLIWSLVGRLILSPCIASGVILLLGLDGIVAQALFIASSYPSSRNSAQLALEYNQHPEYAAQAVLLSTLLSSFTVAVVVYLSTVLYG
ncbi:AEC family transporter [Paenibacillus turpanensis]|uniref:AEC family transporter n=1 Tax=Paenibacillus turpanensis TaxID=2689078 RepID=UPI00140DA51B|nr:AEC family transporter [Paenibacillus turpanensis]